MKIFSRKENVSLTEKKLKFEVDFNIWKLPREFLTTLNKPITLKKKTEKKTHNSIQENKRKISIIKYDILGVQES